MQNQTFGSLQKRRSAGAESSELSPRRARRFNWRLVCCVRDAMNVNTGSMVLFEQSEERGIKTHESRNFLPHPIESCLYGKPMVKFIGGQKLIV